MAFAKLEGPVMQHATLLRSLFTSLVVGASAMALGVSHAKPPKRAETSSIERSATAASPPTVNRPDFGKEKPSKESYQVAQWVLNSGDNEGSSFVIVDKAKARVYVFGIDGKLRGAAPALLGLAKGDETYPGVGDRELSNIAEHERTTPAGRYVAEPGINAHGVDIVWVDYEAAVSMHRVITNNPAERRLQRLSSPDPGEHRISFGCINLPVRFYEKVLAPTVNNGATIIYVLPETQPPGELFGFRDAGKGKAPQTVPRVASAFYLDGA
jgi:hypothetical protein